ncbi:MAG: tetratricopeptide repeat protein [Bryobacteraceae bacterium]
MREAIANDLAAAKAKPNDPQAAGHLGMLLYAYGQPAAARAAFERAAILDPARYEWTYYLGVAQLADGLAQPAVASLRTAVALRSDSVPAQLKLGDALLASGDSAGAAAAYQKVIEHPAAKYGYARATGQAEFHEKALAQFPQFGAAMFALAQHYQRAGRAQDAARLLRDYPRFKTVAPPVDDPALDAIDALNQGPTSLLKQAQSLESHGQLAAAAELQAKALALDPKLVQAHVNLISLYGRLGDAARATEHYKAAIALDANASEAYYNYGVLCYQQGRRAEARTAFEKALSLDASSASAHTNLGALLQEQGQLDAAAAHFTKAIELDPGQRLARFNFGRILANRRNYAAAIAQFEQIVNGDDDATPTYLYALGATQARAGDRAHAIETLERARTAAFQKTQPSVVASIDRDLLQLKAK